MTAGEIRLGLKRGPLVEAERLGFPVLANGEDHIVAGWKEMGKS